MLFRAQPDHRLSRASTLCGPHVRRIRECPIVGIMPVLRSLCQGRIQTSPTKPYRPAVPCCRGTCPHGMFQNPERSPALMHRYASGLHGSHTVHAVGIRRLFLPTTSTRETKQQKSPAKRGLFYLLCTRRYLKSSRSCTLALSVRSSTSTPLGGVNWKVLLPSMTSGMNLVKFTSLWLP